MSRSRWRITPWHMVGGAALYSGTAYAFYSYLSAHKLPAGQPGGTAATLGAAMHSTYDAIADSYDAAIGSEEWSMGTHHLRKWLLNHASGDVLEVSAGTGRNLPHYTLAKLRSLTLTDLSLHMLQRAEDKYYDDLKLGERHPGTRATFCICDAHCMAVALPADARVHTLPALRQAHAAGVSYAAAEDPGIAPTASGSSWLSLIFRLGSRSGSGTRAGAAPTQEAPAGAAAQLPGSSRPGEPAVAQAQASSIWKPWTWLAGDRGRCSAGACHTCCSSGDEASAQGRSYPARCTRGCTETGLPLSKFAAASFDTVIDAFGLCSHEDPVQVLREMSRVCKPGGKILLLEHGRGHYDWLNARLDGGAEQHMKKWGCWWNRDIEALINKAGLKVDKLSRRHFGTTYVCIARPATQA